MNHESCRTAQSERLDKVVAALGSVGSRSRAREAIVSGKVTVNGFVVSEPGVIVEGGAEVTVTWNRPGTASQRVKGRQGLDAAGLRVLFEDDAVVAIDKPPGLLTDTADQEQHRTRDSAWKRLRTYLKASGATPRTVHRIDRDTSGVVLFAKNAAAEHHLRTQFRDRRPQRTYLALIAGSPAWENERWRDMTRWHKGIRQLQVVPDDTVGAWETISDVVVVQRLGTSTLVEVNLVTGRRNQIRLQASTRGYPLLGERLYGQGPPAPRQMLHARRLVVVHPTLGTPLELECPLPVDWRDLMRALSSP